MKAIYTVFRTSTGKFRIKVNYSDGTSGVYGGDRGRTYLYPVESLAQIVAEKLNNQEMSLESFNSEETQIIKG